MSVGLVTRGAIEDLASAIRLRTGRSSGIAPEDMASLVGRIYGPPMEMPQRSSDRSLGLVSDTVLASIADAIRDATGSESTMTPSDMVDAILAIDCANPFDVILESTEIARRSQYNTNASGVNTKSSRYDSYAQYFVADASVPAGYILDSSQSSNSACMLDAKVPAGYSRLFLDVYSTGRSGTYNTSTVWFRSGYGVTGYYGGNYAGSNVRDAVTLTRYSGTADQTNSQAGVVISVTSMYTVPRQIVEVDISGITEDFYIGLHRCDNRTVLYGIVAAWEGFDVASYLANAALE